MRACRRVFVLTPTCVGGRDDSAMLSKEVDGYVLGFGNRGLLEEWVRELSPKRWG